MTSAIEWTDETLNPFAGCSKISEGCLRCYAEKMACRLAHMGHKAYQQATRGEPIKGNPYRKWNGTIVFRPDQLLKPLRWKKPRRVFICSMGDLFHERAPADKVREIFRVIMSPRCQHHTFIVLTKRPKEMAEYVDVELPNLWLGITAENQKRFEVRMEHFAPIPAAVKFISYEPALDWLFIDEYAQFIDWLIAGCESGSGRRRSSPSRFRQVRDDCEFHGIPFFLKQMDIGGKLVKMPELDGRTWGEFPR